MRDFSLPGKCPICRCSWESGESEIHVPLCSIVKDLIARVEKLEEATRVSGTENGSEACR